MTIMHKRNFAIAALAAVIIALALYAWLRSAPSAEPSVNGEPADQPTIQEAPDSQDDGLDDALRELDALD